MTSYCYRQPTRTETILSTTTIRSTSFLTSVSTLDPTGTQLTGRVTTTRIPSVTSIASEITRRTTYYSSSCTTYTRSTYTTLPYPYGSSRGRVPAGVIAFAVLLGLWAAVFLGAVIYLLCFSKTAKRERMRKAQGGFSQNQVQNHQPQQYTPVSQDPLFARSETHYPPTSTSPYGGVTQNLNPNPQGSYTAFQNFNAPNIGTQGTNQWPTQNLNTPSAASFASGPGPGYIPPGAANPVYGSPGAGTVSYSMSSTTPSPPPGPPGPGSDPHRLLYTQQNDRLSAAVSLVHPYQPQPQPQEQPSYSTTGPAFGQQPQQQSSQTYLSTQYRGYAEPSYNTRI